jgi:hypothetical protein
MAMKRVVVIHYNPVVLYVLGIISRDEYLEAIAREKSGE